MLIEKNSFDYNVGPTMSKQQEIYSMLCTAFKHNRQTEEYIYLICLDTKSKFLGITELVHGTIFAALCSTWEMFQIQKIGWCDNSATGNIILNDIASFAFWWHAYFALYLV